MAGTGANVGSLWVSILARTDGFVKGLNDSSKRVKIFGRDVTAQTKVLNSYTKALLGIGAGFSAVKIVSELRQTSIAMDELIDSSKRIGISVDMLGAFRHGAQLSGVSAEILDSSLLRMTRNMVKGADGGKELAAAMRRIGLDVGQVSKLKADQQFFKIADAISQLRTEGERGRAAVDIFGKSGAQLIPLFEDGADGIKKMEAEARKLGITFSPDSAKKVAEFNDEMDRLSAVLGGLKQDIVISVSPAATTFAKTLKEALQGMKIQGANQSESGGWLRSLGRLFNLKSFGDAMTDRRVFRREAARENKKLREDFRRFPVGSMRSLGRMPQDARKNPAWLQDFAEDQETVARGTAAGLRAMGKVTGLDRLAGIFSSQSFKSGLEKFAEGFKAADNFARRWAEKDFLRRLLPIGQKTDEFFRERGFLDEDIEREMIIAANSGKKKPSGDPFFFREGNAPLEKGTMEAFKAAQSHKFPERQLKLQTEANRLLSDIAKNTSNFSAAEVGIA